jgi:hypothetical protein
VIKVIQVPKARLEHRALQVQQELKVLQEHKVLLVLKVLKVQ